MPHGESLFDPYVSSRGRPLCEGEGNEGPGPPTVYVKRLPELCAKRVCAEPPLRPLARVQMTPPAGH